uniref:Crossover junction endonuclease MUS81 n=1 Tax=Salarias fasciatus TaxID=181472 RepID=A0A672JCT2_SALFA
MPASEPVRLGRKRVLPRCPNPLFLRWLTELRDEAREKGLKIQYTYQKAICSLNKYPLPLQNAREAKILQNFGDGICKLLDQKLEKFYRENGSDAPIHSLPEGAPPAGPEAPPTKMKAARADGKAGGGGGRKRRPYVPQKGSGGYAVLLTLYRHSQIPGAKGFMFKLELQSEAQRLCDKSFTVVSPTSPPPGGLLLQEPAGQDPQSRQVLRQGSTGSRSQVFGLNVVDLTWSDDDKEEGRTPLQTRSRKPNPSVNPASLTPRRSLTARGSSHRKQELVKELQRNGVAFDVRKLNVGDFLWVAREKVAPLPGQLRAPDRTELVLDYIVERKRMDDLCGSIIDGRFREQKFRLKRCGLRRPVYLVEECGSAASHLSLPESTLQQAIVNTQVVDGFFVKRVQDVRESAAYLTIMTRHLTKLYQNRTLTCRSRELQGDAHATGEVGTPCCSLMSFAEFNHGAVKNKCQTVREVFARQLMQISGLSGDKAAAILQQYSTPSSLLGAYQRCSSESEKEKLLSSIRYGKLKRSVFRLLVGSSSGEFGASPVSPLPICVRRNLGPALSRTVYQLYCTQGALS